MNEIELKFQVPASARAALRRAVGTATATRVRLQAVYADTADQRLAEAGFALRLRKEGRRWVQTLKGRGADVMTRLEDNVPLPPQPGVPALDPARHAGTAAGHALLALLDGAPLEPRYRTDIWRLRRLVRSGGALVEVAFDEGRILAGDGQVAVCELEFELLSGPPGALLALAERWVARFGLHLDVRTKSERGHRLALGRASVPPVMASPAAWPRDAGAAAVAAATLHGTLAHLLPNMAELTAGDGGPEHLHQVRVSLRRMRTALRVFGRYTADPVAALALEQALREPFARLAAARDADALAASLLPALAAAQADAHAELPPPLPVAAGEAPAAVLADPAFTRQLLRIMQLALATAAQPQGEAPMAQVARDLLRPGWRRALRGAAAFDSASDDERHRLRRQLKRLRYTAEFLLPVLPARAAREALQALRRALDALGEFNDAGVAVQHYGARTAQEPQAWFALGWLAARRAVLQRRAARRLTALAQVRRWWPARR